MNDENKQNQYYYIDIPINSIVNQKQYTVNEKLYNLSTKNVTCNNRVVGSIIDCTPHSDHIQLRFTLNEPIEDLFHDPKTSFSIRSITKVNSTEHLGE